VGYPTLVLLALLLIALGAGIGYGVTVRLRPVPVVSVPPPSSPIVNPPANTASPNAIPPELELRYQLLKNQLDNACGKLQAARSAANHFAHPDQPLCFGSRPELLFRAKADPR